MPPITSARSRIGSALVRPLGSTRHTPERPRASAANTIPSAVQRIGGGGVNGYPPLCGVSDPSVSRRRFPPRRAITQRYAC